MSETVQRAPRVRRSVRRLAIVAFAILLPVAVHSLWDYVELQRLIREIESIRDAGDPVRVGDDDVEPFRGQRSAGSYYLAAAVLSPRGEAPIITLGDVRLWLDGADWLSHPADALDVLRSTTERARASLALADQGALFEYRGLPYDTEYSLRSQDFGDVLRAISARTIALALNGEGDRAVDSAIIGLQMRRVLRDVAPILIREDFQTSAILSFSRPSAAGLQRLQTALEQRDDDGIQAVSAILRERARAIERFWREYYGNDPRWPRVYRLPARGLLERTLRPWISRQLVAALHDWAGIIEGIRRAWPHKATVASARLDQFQADPVRPSQWPWSTMGPAAMLRFAPAGRLVELAQPDILVTDRASRVAVAIERFRRDHAGELPLTLDSLIPEYLLTIPADPLTASPLLYRRADGSYVVYGVGTDRKDDGGALVQAGQRGAARPFRRGPDVGVRILIRQ